MVVDIHKFAYRKFYESQTLGAEYLKAGFHEHFKTASHLPVIAKAMADFIIADTFKSSDIVAEVKKGAEPVSTRWIPFMTREHSAENRLEQLEEQFNNLVRSTWSYLFTERDIKEMGKLSKGMLEGSKKMRELTEKLQEADDKG